MKENKEKVSSAKEIMAANSDFKGYTIEEIRFHRALIAMEAEFCKTKFLKSWGNVQKMNPLSPSGSSSLPVKAGSIALKMVSGLNYIDYLLLGFSLFSGAKKIYSFFRKGKKK